MDKIEVEPIGVERDRQIADKRGDIKYYKCLRHSKCDECEAKSSEQCSEMIIDGPRIIKPYSTDITSAMELWQEMREAGGQPTLSVVKDFVACEAWINYDQEDHDLISNLDNDKSDKSTEAAAISECYLNWKSRL